VRQTWHDLTAMGSDEISAFHTCTTLYLIYHPTASLQEARRLVAEWLDRS
jgi:hypothetical protein